jgi:hypothetical protein
MREKMRDKSSSVCKPFLTAASSSISPPDGREERVVRERFKRRRAGIHLVSVCRSNFDKFHTQQCP